MQLCILPVVLKWRMFSFRVCFWYCQICQTVANAGAVECLPSANPTSWLRGVEGLPHPGSGALKRWKHSAWNGCHDQPSVMEYENVFCECIGFSRAPGGTPQSQMNGRKKQPSIEKIKKQSCAPVTFKRYFSLSLSCFKQSPVRNESRNQYTWGHVWICEGELKIHKHRSQAEFDYVSLPKLLEASGSCVW